MGSVPLKVLKNKSRSVRLVKSPISVGSLPVNLLLDKDREKRFFKRQNSVESNS